MSLDWGKFVNVTVPKKHPVVFHAFCQDCGREVKACWRCEKRRAEDQGGACRTCWNSFACPQPDDPTDPSVPCMIICEQCDKQRVLMNMYPDWDCWKNQDLHDNEKEVWRYNYKAACRCCPLSPTNVVRTPRFVETQFQRPTEIWNRKADARRAFEEEMKFSGNAAQALLVYSSFFQNRPKDSKGHLTGAQLLQVVKKNQ